MTNLVRIVAQHVDEQTGKIIESVVCREEKIVTPTKLKDLGYLHSEQINMLSSIQDFKIKHQSILINQNNSCPKCGKRSISQGIRKSTFHAALTDHEVFIRRRRCNCGWGSSYTLDGIYGSSMHPDLLEKQALQGTDNSYRNASKNLNAESNSIRPINNDDRIRKSVSKVGDVVGIQKLNSIEQYKVSKAVKELIVVVDGGHVKSKKEDSRSFEAMIATVYAPKNIKFIDKNHNEITQKTSVASSMSDNQETIKQLLLNACRKEGMNATVTRLTCITDGASNCWSITKTLEFYSKNLTHVLDWFHITKKFTVIHKTLLEPLKERLEKVKWHLWHGASTMGLTRLEELIKDVSDKITSDRLTSLYEYINRNKPYLVNYEKRQSNGLPFTSTVAETSVNSLINYRQKCNQKMQWSRSGSHNILQIRTSVFSKTWQNDWEMAQNKIYKLAA